MWKLFNTEIIAKNIEEKAYFLMSKRRDVVRKAGGQKNNWSIVDKAAPKVCMKRKTNLAMAWTDYREVYNMIWRSWIGECQEIFGKAKDVRKFLTESMKAWKAELISWGESLGDANIRLGDCVWCASSLGHWPQERQKRATREETNITGSTTFYSWILLSYLRKS